MAFQERQAVRHGVGRGEPAFWLLLYCFGILFDDGFGCDLRNYNPVERYFFDRVTRNRPVCVPYGGKYITQLGHCEDLAAA